MLYLRTPLLGFCFAAIKRQSSKECSTIPVRESSPTHMHSSVTYLRVATTTSIFSFLHLCAHGGASEGKVGGGASEGESVMDKIADKLHAYDSSSSSSDSNDKGSSIKAKVYRLFERENLFTRSSAVESVRWSWKLNIKIFNLIVICANLSWLFLVLKILAYCNYFFEFGVGPSGISISRFSCFVFVCWFVILEIVSINFGILEYCEFIDYKYLVLCQCFDLLVLGSFCIRWWRILES